jgi:hypothetical protein
MPPILILIVMILGFLLILLAGLGLPPATEPPKRYHFGWLGLAFVVLAWLLANGQTLTRGT